MITWTPETVDLDWLEVFDWAEMTKALEAALTNGLDERNPLYLLLLEAKGSA